MGFIYGSAGKESACNAGDVGSVPGLGRSPGEEKRYPLQYSGLENSTDCMVPGVTESQTQLSYFEKKNSIIGYFKYYSCIEELFLYPLYLVPRTKKNI